MMRTILTLPLLVTFLTVSSGRTSSTPFYTERFDSVTAPLLPSGWITSKHRTTAGDFLTSVSLPRAGSAPNCLSATDARVSQSVWTPPLSFTGRIPDSLEFFERRTGSFTAGLMVEAIINDDTLAPVPIGDTLKLTTANNGAYQRRALAVPALLAGASNIRFRLRIIGNPGGGGTAVLRLEDITITVKRIVDLAATSITASPAAPRSGDTLRVETVVRNRAAAGQRSGQVMLYDAGLAVDSVNFDNLFAENDPLRIGFILPHITGGIHPLTVRLLLIGDEDTSNDTATTTVIVGERERAVIINEIMAAPLSGHPEWVEVYNTTGGAVPLNGWRISDAGPTKAAINGSGSLPPFSYAVITTDTNQFKTLFDTGTPLFQAFFSALNNSGDAVVLYDRSSGAVDSLYFRTAWGIVTGRSLERKEPVMPSADSASWGTSRHPEGATPGRINSLTKKPHDLTVRISSRSPVYPVLGQTIEWDVHIVNIGTHSVDSAVCSFYEDADGDSVLSPSERRSTVALSSIPPGDSIAQTFSLAGTSPGGHRFVFLIAAHGDDDTSNDRCDAPLMVGMPAGSIVISEFLYAPEGEDPEWIELHNPTTSAVSTERWTVSDNGTARAVVPAMTLLPSAYAVLTTDSIRFREMYPSVSIVRQTSFTSLNNTTADAVVLRDERGAVMDSVRYLPNWGGMNGRSLQRYDLTAGSDSSNWRSALPTPGVVNSIGRKEIDIAIRRAVMEWSGETVRITVTVFNEGRTAAIGARVMLVRSTPTEAPPETVLLPPIAPLDSAAAEFQLLTGQSGRETMLLTAVMEGDQRPLNDTMTVVIDHAFTPLAMIINEILYEPAAGMPEFVELCNRSTDTLDLTGWSVRDQPSASGTRTIIPLPSMRVAPGALLVIASDTMGTIPPERYIIAPGLSLSNSGEGIALYDLTDMVIDSVRYDPLWHLRQVTTAGRSLERIDRNGASQDGRNWSSCVHRTGSTPLQRNSIDIGSLPASSSLDLSPNPFSPDRDGFEDFLSIRFTLPSGSVMVRIRIFDAAGRMVRTLVRNEAFPGTGSVIWDGMDDDGNRVRMGIYILFLEALDPSGNAVRTLRSAAVAAHSLR